jgi:hypothetical protein
VIGGTTQSGLSDPTIRRQCHLALAESSFRRKADRISQYDHGRFP